MRFDSAKGGQKIPRDVGVPLRRHVVGSVEDDGDPCVAVPALAKWRGTPLYFQVMRGFVRVSPVASKKRKGHLVLPVGASL